MQEKNRLALGIDTGGTFTDAVLLDVRSGKITASAKALTTYADLSIGISEAIQGLWPFDPAEVEAVSLSSTLATNAIVEERGRPICLVLIGYDSELLRNRGFMSELGTDDVVFVRGGHDVQGDEQEPLDQQAIAEIAAAKRGQVAAFAVSSYFSVRNSAHELRAKALLEELTGLPVTCGHELSQQLNSITRATTAALNARLIPLLRDLINAVQATLSRLGVTAPLMVVKGDGSLMAAEVALARPVETILSGPAASAVGGHYLARQDDIVVVDMGGTTTDIAILSGGHPRLNPEGARVGRWQTMVEAVDVRTVALGGDSHVRYDREGFFQIGPRRVISLSRLAAEREGVLEVLERQWAGKHLHQEAGIFVCPTGQIPDDLPELYAPLRDGPMALEDLLLQSGYPYAVRNQIFTWQTQGLVTLAGFTPSDALHVLGQFRLWSPEAARFGAGILCRLSGLTTEEVCHRVVQGVVDMASREIVAKTISDAIGPVAWPGDHITEYILRQALDHGGNDPSMDYAMRIKRPLVAIGAPVDAYFPAVAQQLHGELVIPPYAGVANAVGAVAGSVIQRLLVFIRPLEHSGFRLHSVEEVQDFQSLPEAIAAATTRGEALVRERAVEAGAVAVETRVDREDDIAITGQHREEIYLGTRLAITAIGRVIGEN